LFPPAPRRSALIPVLCLILFLAGCTGESDTVRPGPALETIHVAAGSSTANPGTAEAPVPTLDQAMALTLAGPARTIKVATGTYHASGNVQWRLTGGVDIIGGCDRDTWQPQPGQYSLIELGSNPIRGLGITVPTHIRGLHLLAAVSPAGTSNPLYLNGCGEALVFEDCRFQAAAGRDSQPGYDGSDGSAPAFEGEGRPGQDAVCAQEGSAAGGMGGQQGCNGGDGGAGGGPGQAGSVGAPGECYGEEATPGGSGGAPGQDGQDGHNGLDGLDGINGEATAGLGSLVGSLFLPPAAGTGTYGQNGRPGGGGGGGGGPVGTEGCGAGGGGGGSGGYAGHAGSGGRGGGHSIALISVAGEAVFRNCRFVAGDGGRGGQGGDGGLGQPGSPGGPGGTACSAGVGRGGRGGDGGHGGFGGAGAGGNGGSSLAVLLVGVGSPAFGADCTFATGQPGQPGQGGLSGDLITLAPDGYPGIAAPIQELGNDPPR
jgi:hypothetical protein